MNETTYTLSLVSDPATGAAKDLTLSQYGKLFAAGREGSMGGSGLVEPLSPYEQSLWVYRCVSAILRSVSGVPLRLSRKAADRGQMGFAGRKAMRGCRRVRQGRASHLRSEISNLKSTEGDIVESGPAWALLNAPNPLQRWGQFAESLVGYWLLRGRAGLLLADMVGRTPRSLHVLDGQAVTPDVRYDPSGVPQLAGYEYRHPENGRPIPLSPDELMYVNFWGPGKPMAGMPPIRPGRLAISTDYAASTFNAAALANGGQPGVIFLFENRLEADQKAEMRSDYARTHGGPENANRPLFAGGLKDVKTLAQTFSELQFNEGKKTTRTELCALFGVPPTVAGWLEAAGDSSAYFVGALGQFWQQTVFPLLDDLAAIAQLIADRTEGGLEAWFDVEDQPVVQAMRMGRIDSGKKLFDMGRPFADINELLDLGLPDDEVSLVGFLPIGLTPARDIISGQGLAPQGPEGVPPIEPPAEPGNGEQEPGNGNGGSQGTGNGEQGTGEEPEQQDGVNREPKTVDRNGRSGNGQRSTPLPHRSTDVPSDAERSALWHAAWRPVTAAQKAFTGRIRAFFVGQEREVRENLRRQIPAKSAKADESVILRILFNIREANGRMTVAATAAMEQVTGLSIRQVLGATGLAGAALDQAVEQAGRSPVVQDLIRRQAWRATSAVNSRTLTVLQESLREGLSAGESVNQLAGRVGGIYQARRSQALRIAENTVGQVFSQARAEGERVAGFTHKGWLHGPGAVTPRATHIAAGIRYMANPIPRDELFEVGTARLRYPRDYEANSPEETIACHCLSVGRFAAQTPRAAVLAHLKACVEIQP